MWNSVNLFSKRCNIPWRRSVDWHSTRAPTSQLRNVHVRTVQLSEGQKTNASGFGEMVRKIPFSIQPFNYLVIPQNINRGRYQCLLSTIHLAPRYGIVTRLVTITHLQQQKQLAVQNWMYFTVRCKSLIDLDQITRRGVSGTTAFN
jgi:hypothetical protein